jgi:hypothetical protein
MTPQPPPKDPLDFTDQYNTPIPPASQPAFDQWANTQTKSTGKDPRGDRYDYDVNGFFLSGAATASNGHGSDQFKKPNHPTFSDESQYHGRDGYVGGKWVQGGYQPSVTNLQMHPLPQLQNYFSTVEPDSKLLPPAPVPQPSGANGQYRISDFRARPTKQPTPAQVAPRKYFGQ